MEDKHQQSALDDNPFFYELQKNTLVFIYWKHQHVTTLKGNAAARFLNKMENCSESEAQLLMAKTTGNFKRGNE